MVRIDRLRGDANKRILRCSEGKNIWYRLWINPEDMMRIEPLLEGGDRIWMEEMYYTFFYEIRNGRRLIGKGRVKEILDILLWDECQGCFILWLLCVWCGISGYASNTRCQNFLVLKMCICLQGTLNVRASKVVVLKTAYGSVKFNI